MTKSSANRVGFRFHSKDRWRYIGFMCSMIFVVVMCSYFAFDDVEKNFRSWEGTLAFSALMTILALLVVLFAVMMGRTFEFTKSAGLILEFGENGLIDRSILKIREIPYSEIEIFSPPLEMIFRQEPAIRELRAELGTDEFLSIACRRKSTDGAPIDDYTFFQKIAPLRVDEVENLETAIRSRMDHRIGGYELLVQDFFDDDTTAGFSGREEA